MVTVADVLKKIERLKKDLEYVRTFQEKWRDQRDRFPKIYEGIVEQERAFLRRIEELRSLKVDSAVAAWDMADEPGAAPSPASPFSVAGMPEGPKVEPPGIDGAVVPTGLGSRDSGDERRSAAGIDVGERQRKRTTGSTPAIAADATADAAGRA